MRDVRLISPRLGEFTFDGAQAVLSSFSCSYPRLTRKAIAKNAALGVELLPAAVGEGRIRIEGYLIPSEGALFDKKRLLCAIASVGGEFALTVDGLRRTVETEKLEFLTEGAFGRGRGDHFVLTLISASPFFEGDEVTFYGRYTVADALYFPHRGQRRHDLEPRLGHGLKLRRRAVRICRAFSFSGGGDIVYPEVGRIFGQLRRDAEH